MTLFWAYWPVCQIVFHYFASRPDWSSETLIEDKSAKLSCLQLLPLSHGRLQFGSIKSRGNFYSKIHFKSERLCLCRNFYCFIKMIRSKKFGMLRRRNLKSLLCDWRWEIIPRGSRGGDTRRSWRLWSRGPATSRTLNRTRGNSHSQWGEVLTELPTDDLQQELVGEETAECDEASEQGEQDGNQADIEVRPEAGYEWGGVSLVLTNLLALMLTARERQRSERRNDITASFSDFDCRKVWYEISNIWVLRSNRQGTSSDSDVLYQ